MVPVVSGFSKMAKEAKIAWLAENYLDNDPALIASLKSYWNDNSEIQRLHDDFIENTLSNYYLPFAVAPNFLINGKMYAVPMVIEESSVVAAASNAAKFWLERGGFKAEVTSTRKSGQIHLNYYGDPVSLKVFFNQVEPKLRESIADIQKNMQARGGGLQELQLIDASDKLDGYFQIHATFETLDAMGANFINSCLEAMASCFEKEADSYDHFDRENKPPEVVMSILSNYVPHCLVKAEVSCRASELGNNGVDGQLFAEKIVRAVEIARVEKYRAVTHNKGVMNGIDAVVIATGNDFRAVEAGIHAYASASGGYSSLTHAELTEGIFRFSIEIPLALGTVGGLTSLHPMVKVALEILQKPSAKELMKIVAVAGLAQNFAALRSLVTTGIQKGHMKMHLMNILNQMGANAEEKKCALDHFQNNPISHSAVSEFIEQLRTSV